jgi:hypothetical protein
MKTFRLLYLVLGFILMGILFCGCKKDDNNNDNSQILTVSAEDEMTVTSLFEEIFSEVEESLVDVSSLKSVASVDCKTLRYIGPDASLDSFNVYEIDFGDSCVRDGSLKSGKIIVTTKDAKDYWEEEDLKRIVTFSNFTINGISIQGTDYIYYEGKDNLGRPVFLEMLDTSSIVLKDKSKITFGFIRMKTWVQGFDKVYRLDDIFQITGVGGGINRQGKEFLDSIPENKPLVRYCPTRCNWIKSGQTFIIINKDTATLDYGNGTCDNFTTLSIKNGSKSELEINP